MRPLTESTKVNNISMKKMNRLNKTVSRYGCISLLSAFLPMSYAMADGTTSFALGLGGGFSDPEYIGVDNEFEVLPLVFFDNSWVSLVGTTLDVKVANINNTTFSVRGKYALGDGYDDSDSYIFDGMDSRDSSLWIGPAMTWSNPMFDLKLEALVDTMDNSEGQQASVSISKGFRISERLQVEPSIGTTWYSDKYVNYYYGVKSSEVNANRSQYDGKSTTVLDAGVRFNYALDKQQSLALDVSVKQFGDEIEDSPLVDKKTTAAAYLGYIYRFK
ncbi:MipA/OmpV family protein [Marinomonas shanghaiensis]|uniref:MipA/OmpV family protein n=1 Tax=Marinomonas shanghaiensis TaxID=2202418 RepID=UPI003A8DB5F5